MENNGHVMDHIATRFQKTMELKSEYKEGSQEVQLSVLHEDDVLSNLKSSEPLQKNSSLPQIIFYK